MKLTFIKKRLVVGLVIAVAIGVVSCLAFHFNLFYSLQRQSGDFLFQAAALHQGAEPEEKVVVVGIDDKSLEQLGRFSQWPRSYHAQLIDILARAGARVIVFDILFSEPGLGDEELARSIREAGNVVLPVVREPATNHSAGTPETTRDGNLTRPLAVFEDGASTLGHANVIPDSDGVVRKLSIAIRDDGDYQPSLALAAAAEYLRRPRAIESTMEGNVLPFAGRSIPLMGNNEMLINYIENPRGSGGVVNFPMVSFVDILSGEVDPSLFRDKIVITGAAASGLGDTFWTPVGRMLNGVEIHATAIHTILAGNFLRPAPASFTMVVMLVLALLCGLAVLRLRVLWSSLSTLFLCVAYLLIAFSFFDNGIVLNMLYPPLAIIGTFVGENLYKVTSEQSEKRAITRTFGRYVSSPLVDKILAAMGKGELKLGGEEQEVTVAFADVRGFTKISEKMPAAELVRVLNAYLSIVIRAVLKYDGMINKFGGDSVMAIWNAPVESAEHALLAVKAAVHAQQAIREWQEKETTIPKMEFGIGINTGRAVAGNMGSEDRLEYSVVGDTVNTAARLAGAAPGGKVWIGVSTFLQVKSGITARPLDPLEVKGKREPISAYEVLDVTGPVD